MKQLFLIMLTAILSVTSTNLKAQQTNKIKDITIEVKVKGLTCSSDCKDISKNVKLLDGVSVCESKGKPGATTKFTIKYNPELVKYDKIVKAIEDTPGCQDSNDRPYKVKKKRK